MDAAGLERLAGKYSGNHSIQVRVVGTPAGGAGKVEFLCHDSRIVDGFDGGLRGCDYRIPVIFKYFRPDGPFDRLSAIPQADL